MKLLTEEQKKGIPPLYTNEEKPMQEQIVVYKFYHPWAHWTWYVLEGEQEGDDFMFYGLVDGHELEFGSFSLKELEQIEMIKRDMNFVPQPVSNFHPGWGNRD